MGRIERFEDIESWKAARELVAMVYSATRQEGFSRDFALCDQIRRAAVSILSNIAEGFERNGNKEFLQFLSIAKGSCGEVRAQLYVALDQKYLDEAAFESVSEKLVTTSRLISGLMRYLRESDMRGAKFQ
ncbi:MAG: four helix bundle protein [Pyrinomonadaceae bacterium]